MLATSGLVTTFKEPPVQFPEIRLTGEARKVKAYDETEEVWLKLNLQTETGDDVNDRFLVYVCIASFREIELPDVARCWFQKVLSLIRYSVPEKASADGMVSIPLSLGPMWEPGLPPTHVVIFVVVDTIVGNKKQIRNFSLLRLRAENYHLVPWVDSSDPDASID